MIFYYAKRIVSKNEKNQILKDLKTVSVLYVNAFLARFKMTAEFMLLVSGY